MQKKYLQDNSEFIKFMEENIIGKENRNHSGETITTLFNFHNSIYVLNKEWTKSCSGCRERVWGRLMMYYDEVKPLQRDSIIEEILEVVIPKKEKKKSK